MESKDQPTAPQCTPLYNRDDPLQKEISSLLKDFQYDIMGIIALGKDGIMRSLTADRRVLSAVPFRPELITAFNDRLSEDYRKQAEAAMQGADGTKTPKQKWFEPDEGIVPAPLPQEKLNEMRNASEERKEQTRAYMRNKDKNYVDAMGVLD
ncbi:hypothetical protein FB567DRAFT_587925 [Paraphoma chrysanthemicola]|uniref:Uncharacterized protein n=1 Tax=Paraphoma chrysanthemicola TaxID=798071 RepID=A0A8K0RF69_9PLEO|nr:hypothetical protein FB567DRAFT_587925 [Paraphoma chrysanthemicola]